MDKQAIAERAYARIDEIVEDAQREQWRGMWTLFVREIRRFWSVSRQTIISPVITTMLYFLVFGYSLGDRLQEIDGITYIDFLVPGLVMLAVINNAYTNAGFSLFIAKVHGMIVDLLVTPISYTQFLLAYVAAAMVRAMLVGTIIWVVALLMGASLPTSAPLALLFMALTAMVFSLLGLCVAIVASEFDQVNFLPNFLITPLTFLGGVFYSVEMLPDFWRRVSYGNPVLHMVNGLRYSMTGVSDVPWWTGLVILMGLSAAFGLAAHWLLRSGYNLRD
jgi:ABC-2 type transport system permease protein